MWDVVICVYRYVRTCVSSVKNAYHAFHRLFHCSEMSSGHDCAILKGLMDACKKRREWWAHVSMRSLLAWLDGCLKMFEVYKKNQSSQRFITSLHHFAKVSSKPRRFVCQCLAPGFLSSAQQLSLQHFGYRNAQIQQIQVCVRALALCFRVDLISYHHVGVSLFRECGWLRFYAH